MRKGHVRDRLTVACRKNTMREVHVRCRRTIVSPKAMAAGNARCHLAILLKAKTIQAIHTRRWISNVHNPQPMRPVHDRRLLSNVHATSHVAWQRFYVGIPMCAEHRWYRQAIFDVGRQICATIDNAGKSRITLVDLRVQVWDDRCNPRLMSAHYCV